MLELRMLQKQLLLVELTQLKLLLLYMGMFSNFCNVA